MKSLRAINKMVRRLIDPTFRTHGCLSDSNAPLTCRGLVLLNRSAS